MSNKKIFQSKLFTLVERIIRSFTKETETDFKKYDEQWKSNWTEGVTWLDFVNTLDQKYRLNFSARALISLLLDNSSTYSPYYTDKMSEWKNNYDYLKDISLDLKIFGANFLITFILLLKKESLVESDFRVVDMFSKIQKEVCAFLTVLPQTHPVSQKLFDSFWTKDVYEFMNKDRDSKYELIQNLLFDKKVPLKWKYQADKQMREIVNKEISRNKKNQQCRATQSYFIMVRYFTEGDYYHASLLANQISYMMSLEKKIKADNSFFKYKTIEVCQVFIDNELTDFAYSVLRFSFVDMLNCRPLIYNNKELESVEKFIQQYGFDSKLKRVLEKTIVEFNKLSVKRREETENYKIKKNMIFQAMT